MTPDEVSKNTTPNAIREASEALLGDMYNHPAGHLRGTDDRLVRQVESSIRAIVDERTRRAALWARKPVIMSCVCCAVSCVIACATLVSHHADVSKIQSLDYRLIAFEAANKETQWKLERIIKALQRSSH